MAGISPKKFKSATETKAMLYHNDKLMRSKPEVQHSNEHIDKNMSPYNIEGRGLGYSAACRRYDELIAYADADDNPDRKTKYKNKNHNVGRVVCLGIVYWVPEELEQRAIRNALSIKSVDNVDMNRRNELLIANGDFEQVPLQLDIDKFSVETKRKVYTDPEITQWIHRATETVGEILNADYRIEWYAHFDEQHNYIDPDKGECKSRIHIHDVYVPIVDGRLCCKEFLTRKAFTEINNALEKMSVEEFGVHYNTGEKSKSRGTVEQMKAVSKMVSQIVGEANQYAEEQYEHIHKRKVEQDAIQDDLNAKSEALKQKEDNINTEIQNAVNRQISEREKQLMDEYAEKEKELCENYAKRMKDLQAAFIAQLQRASKLHREAGETLRKANDALKTIQKMPTVDKTVGGERVAVKFIDKDKGYDEQGRPRFTDKFTVLTISSLLAVAAKNADKETKKKLRFMNELERANEALNRELERERKGFENENGKETS